MNATVKPTQLISFEKGKELNKNYNEKRSAMLMERMGMEDANAFWFSIEELERYITYVKETGEAKGYTVDGIRVYLGVYSSEEAKNADYTTVFLAPTVAKGAAQIQRDGTIPAPLNPIDITEIEPLNYGSMGNPPKLNYGG